MQLHEFELRYRAYKWLNHKFDLWWDSDFVLDMVRISSKWKISKPVQEIEPDELHEISLETYTLEKKWFLEANREKEIWFGTLWEYIDRLEYEMKVIKEMWFNSYFLIVADFVRWAKKNMIVVWPWRGSWAWSILAWLLRITDVDPMQFGLLFERFLNPARISMPDFDIDFEDTQREKVIEYVREKYWSDQVCGIGTYMQLASKAAFKDVARVLGVPFERSNQVSSLMPDKISVLEAVETPDGNDELKAIYHSDEKVKQAAMLSEKLQWNMRQLGVHACGIVIAPNKVTKYSPTQYVKEWDTTIVSQYDGPTLETIWILKMDFLGLRNLSVIKNCIKIIKKKCESEKTELPKIFEWFFEDTSFQPPIDDKTTFEKIFQTWDTTGIFQFESEWMRKFLIKLKADSINDLVAMNALYRPGPMEFIPNYIARKNWEEPISYMSSELRQILTEKYWEEVANQENIKLIEDLAPIMNLTYGIAVYQEQLMFLVQSMAGFSLAEADLLRRWVGKKKKEIIEKIKKEFQQKAKDYRDYKKETAIHIYEKMIEPAASYSFNKSHSVCYAMIAYQTAYLKAYYPVEFYASLMRSVEEDTDELSKFISETQNHWISVLTPDINSSFNHVAAIWDSIRLWFFCVKWVWFEIGENIQEERKKSWKFISLENFITRCSHVVNKKSVEWLIKSWWLDSMWDRKTMLENIDTILERSKKSKDNTWWLFGMMEMDTNITFKKILETSMMDKLMMEQEVLRSFVSWNPLDWLYPYIKKFSFISQFKNLDAQVPFVIIWYIKDIKRAKKKWFFIEIEDISWNIEFFVKDVLDFKKFDILVINWFKWRGVSMDKVVKVSREWLIRLAWSKFDPSFTVVKAKSLRLSTDKPQNFVSDNVDMSDTEKPQSFETPKIENPDSYIFKLPENANQIDKILKVINDYPWDKEVTIWNKTVKLSEEWMKKFLDLII